MDSLNNIRYLFGYVGQFCCGYCPGAYWSTYEEYPLHKGICGYCLPLTRCRREYLRWILEL